MVNAKSSQQTSLSIQIREFYLSHMLLLQNDKCYIFGHMPKDLTPFMFQCRLDQFAAIQYKMGKMTDRILQATCRRDYPEKKDKALIVVENFSILELQYINEVVFKVKGSGYCKVNGEAIKKYIVEDIYLNENRTRDEWSFKVELGMHMRSLDKAYRKYLRLINEKQTKRNALKLSGLKEPQLFQIAYLCHNISCFNYDDRASSGKN